jgi:hypothetical protein
MLRHHLAVRLHMTVAALKILDSRTNRIAFCLIGALAVIVRQRALILQRAFKAGNMRPRV